MAEVYRAAAQIILRKGYDATSINDIANELGISVNAVKCTLNSGLKKLRQKVGK